MSRYSRGLFKDSNSNDDTKSITELPARNGQRKKPNLPNGGVAAKHLMPEKHHRDLYGLCCVRGIPVLLDGIEYSFHEKLVISVSGSLSKKLNSLSNVAKEREEMINTVTRVLHLATTNMTGIVASVPQRMQISHPARPDAVDEIELLKERIKDLERCWTGLIYAVQSISTSLCEFGSRLPSLYYENPDIPDYFLRITRNPKLGSQEALPTYFDNIVGFACNDYKYVKTTSPQNLLPLGRTPCSRESHEIQRKMFLDHMKGYHCPSSYISVEQNPYRINNILKRFKNSSNSIAVIDTKKLRKMGIHFERTKVIQDHLGFSPRETMGNRTHWLVENWIPAETFNMISVETFKEVFRMFDPCYKTKTKRDTIPHEVQCRYDKKKGFVIYDPTDITDLLGSMRI